MWGEGGHAPQQQKAAHRRPACRQAIQAGNPGRQSRQAIQAGRQPNRMHACVHACVPDVIAVAPTAGQAGQRQPRKQAAHGIVRGARLRGGSKGRQHEHPSSPKTSKSVLR